MFFLFIYLFNNLLDNSKIIINIKIFRKSKKQLKKKIKDKNIIIIQISVSIYSNNFQS